MMYTRYWDAAQLSHGKRVLEIACGSGQGLGLLVRSVARLVAGDISTPLLWRARAHYGSRVPLVQMSAEALPFADGAFDLVLLFEASYYIPSVGDAIREIARVLALGGTVRFVNANPERPDFISSPHSVHYHTADELRQALTDLGLSVQVEGAFPVVTGGGRWSLVAALVPRMRRLLEAFGLVPKTLRARARLKRLLYGRLIDLPAELPEGFAAVAQRQPVHPGPVRGFKVIYVTGHKRSWAHPTSH